MPVSVSCSCRNDPCSFIILRSSIGLACRFAFELGLTMDHSKSSLPHHEIQLRYRVLRACIYYDRTWAIFSGNPTVIRTSDLPFNKSNPLHSTMLSSIFKVPTQSAIDATETAEWDALLGLMELAVKVVGHVLKMTTTPDSDQDTATKVMAAVALHSELNSWQSQLPSQLRWNSENAETSSALFFYMQ